MPLNYKHLRYFHEVARLGSIQSASEALHVSPQAVSAQIKQLEQRIGQTLLRRDGRGLRLTDAGRLTAAYARQIFELGSELVATLSDHPGGLALPARIGVTDSVPKAMTVISTAKAMREQPAREFIFVEGALDELLGLLATDRIHAVVSDVEPHSNAATDFSVRLVVRSAIAWVAPPELVTGQPFPACLEGAPVVMWPFSSSLSRQVQSWLQDAGVRPRVVARCVDSALIKSLCAAGVGLAPVPLAVVDSVQRQMQLQPLGVMRGVEMSLWLIERPGEPAHLVSWPD